mmetsp:Transcript_24051/g.81215  ORF Transcript_24051/g.81215 Transcript_24051/m.81215 type:complete len:144 (+) Transcript_24051:216-647(+)
MQFLVSGLPPKNLLSIFNRLPEALLCRMLSTVVRQTWPFCFGDEFGEFIKNSRPVVCCVQALAARAHPGILHVTSCLICLKYWATGCACVLTEVAHADHCMTDSPCMDTIKAAVLVAFHELGGIHCTNGMPCRIVEARAQVFV